MVWRLEWEPATYSRKSGSEIRRSVRSANGALRGAIGVYTDGCPRSSARRRAGDGAIELRQGDPAEHPPRYATGGVDDEGLGERSDAVPGG